MRGRVHFWERPEIVEDLGITEEQVVELKTQWYESARVRSAIRARLEIVELELEQLMDGGDPDEEAVLTKVREVAEVRAELFQNHVMEQLALKKILTPEQERKLGVWGPPGRPGAPGSSPGGEVPPRKRIPRRDDSSDSVSL